MLLLEEGPLKTSDSFKDMNEARAINDQAKRRSLYEGVNKEFAKDLPYELELRTLADSFRNYEVVARRESELRMELTRLAPPGPEVVVSVPAFPADIDDARALARIGR